MPKKRTTKARKDNLLKVKIQAEEFGKRRPKPLTFWRTLKRSMMEDEDLPSGYDVKAWWINPNTKYGQTKRWRPADFMDAWRESRSGFRSLMLRIVERNIRRYSR